MLTQQVMVLEYFKNIFTSYDSCKTLNTELLTEYFLQISNESASTEAVN